MKLALRMILTLLDGEKVASRAGRVYPASGLLVLHSTTVLAQFVLDAMFQLRIGWRQTGWFVRLTSVIPLSLIAWKF